MPKKQKPFRIVKHVGQYRDNYVLQYFEKYNDAVTKLTSYKTGHNYRWIEVLCVDGEWYGIA